MFILLLPASNLQGKETFFLKGFNLRDDIIIDKKHRDGNPGAPFIPGGGYSTLDGNKPGAFGGISHDARLSFNDSGGVLLIDLGGSSEGGVCAESADEEDVRG